MVAILFYSYSYSSSVDGDWLDTTHREDTESVRRLLEKGAYKNTPLHLASARGHIGIAKILIEKGAKIEAKDNYGNTPLHLAAKHGHTGTAKMLIEKGAEIESEKHTERETPLHLATQYGRPETVRMLLKKKANINAQDYLGNTPLHNALDVSPSNPDYQNYRNVLNLLIKSGANIGARNKNRDTPLHSAAKCGNVNKAKLLIENGADINSQNNKGNTPLHLAVKSESTVIATELIRNGANIMAPNNLGKTPLVLLSTNFIRWIILDCNTLSLFEQAKIKHNKLTELLAEKDRRTHLQEIIQLIEDEGTTTYSKQTAIATLLRNQDVIEIGDRKQLIKQIPFNHRIFNDNKCREILDFATFYQLEDRDGRTTEQNAEMFCQDVYNDTHQVAHEEDTAEYRAAEIKDSFEMKERLEFIGTIGHDSEIKLQDGKKLKMFSSFMG